MCVVPLSAHACLYVPVCALCAEVMGLLGVRMMAKGREQSSSAMVC